MITDYAYFGYAIPSTTSEGICGKIAIRGWGRVY
jgi:hypothetical protein